MRLPVQGRSSDQGNSENKGRKGKVERSKRRGIGDLEAMMMGYMWRVRLSSFLVGAATTSVAGLCFLYRDYVIAHDSISTQLKGISETFNERHEALNQHITALENRHKADDSKPVESD